MAQTTADSRTALTALIERLGKARGPKQILKVVAERHLLTALGITRGEAMDDFPTYSEGFRARLCGKEIEDNPYTKPSEAWSRWAEGWMDQDHHLNDRDEALASLITARYSHPRN